MYDFWKYFATENLGPFEQMSSIGLKSVFFATYKEKKDCYLMNINPRGAHL